MYEGPKLNNNQSEAFFKKFTELAYRDIPNFQKKACYVLIRDHIDEKIGV
jgi:hypothetical protein